jgi:hypothetical protein
MASTFLWVEGSPSAAENPPHDRRWRAAVADVAGGQSPAREVELDFLIEERRVIIDLDNLVRLALDGLRDAGALQRGLGGLHSILATKSKAPPLGLGVTLVRSSAPSASRPLHEAVELVAESDMIPREGRAAEKDAWRGSVRGAWSGTIGRGPVALDIAAKTGQSLGAMLKPVIDGLESYLGRSTVGRGEFRPLDERIVLLRIRREPDLAVALRVTAGPPRQPPSFRTPPSRPALPRMDVGFTYSMSDLDTIDRNTAWHRIFAHPPRWTVD